MKFHGCECLFLSWTFAPVLIHTIAFQFSFLSNISAHLMSNFFPIQSPVRSVLSAFTSSSSHHCSSLQNEESLIAFSYAVTDPLTLSGYIQPDSNHAEVDKNTMSAEVTWNQVSEEISYATPQVLGKRPIRSSARSITRGHMMLIKTFPMKESLSTVCSVVRNCSERNYRKNQTSSSARWLLITVKKLN